MTAVFSSVRFADSDTLLSGELIDSFIEAVVLPPDALVRAARDCTLVDEQTGGPHDLA